MTMGMGGRSNMLRFCGETSFGGDFTERRQKEALAQRLTALFLDMERDGQSEACFWARQEAESVFARGGTVDEAIDVARRYLNIPVTVNAEQSQANNISVISMERETPDAFDTATKEFFLNAVQALDLPKGISVETIGKLYVAIRENVQPSAAQRADCLRRVMINLLILGLGRLTPQLSDPDQQAFARRVQQQLRQDLQQV